MRSPQTTAIALVKDCSGGLIEQVGWAKRSVPTQEALAATSGLHGLMGTRSVARKQAFDRFWRNARTLSLHDPVDYKARELGTHLFTGTHPQPGVYQ